VAQTKTCSDDGLGLAGKDGKCENVKDGSGVISANPDYVAWAEPNKEPTAPVARATKVVTPT